MFSNDCCEIDLILHPFSFHYNDHCELLFRGLDHLSIEILIF